MAKKLISPCCNAQISGSLGDGVLIGWCSKCLGDLVRQNKTTGQEEWLDGKSPWTNEPLRLVLDSERVEAP